MVVDVAVFAAAVAVIVLVGPRMAHVAQGLAIATGMGGALFGVLFLAIATDIPEIALTPAAVLAGHPTLAIGALLGSTAAQILTIAVADIVYRRGKVMQAAPSSSAIGQSALLIGVLAVPLVAAPLGLTLGWLSIATPVLLIAYLVGLAATRELGETVDAIEPDNADAGSLWLRFALYALLLAAAGVVLERTTSTISDAIGLSPTAGGALLAGVASSLPEYVTVAAAVRNGAIALAVGDAIGSSAFDVFLLGWADTFYKDGSLFALLGPQEISLIGISLVLTTLALFGFVRPTTSPRRTIATETYLMLGVYIAIAVTLVMTR